MSAILLQSSRNVSSVGSPRRNTVSSLYYKSRPYSQWAPLPAAIRPQSGTIKRRTSSFNGISSDQLPEVDQTTWKTKVDESELPVVVICVANWCSSCKKLMPRIETIANASSSLYKFFRLDVDLNPDLAGELGVRSVPTVFVFVNGQPIASFVGLLSDNEFNDFFGKAQQLTSPSSDLVVASPPSPPTELVSSPRTRPPHSSLRNRTSSS
mmetsp:Transcript_19978/g.32772  ORF Transcript_19978/g.32772 Transcript_19978/m.32772 type:complete len:210 (+) Transcript_19978:149-778(+)